MAEKPALKHKIEEAQKALESLKAARQEQNELTPNHHQKRPKCRATGYPLRVMGVTH